MPSEDQGWSRMMTIGSFLKVELPDKGRCVIRWKKDMTMQDVLCVTCEKRHLEMNGHFLRFKHNDMTEFAIVSDPS